MKRLPVLLLFSLLFTLALPAEDPPLWRSKNGHSFEGTFVRLNPGTSVVLKGREGKTVEVPLAALDEASREMAVREAKAAGQPTTAPLFTHQTPVYTLKVNPRKRSLIQLDFKDRGRPLPFANPNLHLFMAEVIDKKYHTIGIREITRTAQDRGSASFEVHYDNDVVLFLVVDLLQDGIGFRYWREEPEGTPQLDLHISMVLPPLVKWELESRTYKGELFPQGIAAEDLEKTLKDYVLTSRYHNRPAQTHPFSEHHKKLYSAKSFSIKQPLTTGELEIASPAEPRQGKVGLHLYDGKRLAEGTLIRFGNLHPESKEQAATFTIRYK